MLAPVTPFRLRPTLPVRVAPRRAVGWVATACIALLPGWVMAADDDREFAGTTLAEIVVTGSREQGYVVADTGALGLPVEISRLPASVTILSDDLLEDLGARSLANVLPYVAGVSNADNGGVNTDEFMIRGFRSANNYINGIRNSLTAEGRPSLDTIERVEIVKGPAGVEGSVTSPGGFVNLITKKPQETFAAEAFASVGDFNFYRVGGDVTGPLADSLAGRLIATFEDKQQWRPGRRHRPILTVAPSLSWSIAARTRLAVEYEYRRQNDPLDRGTIFVRGAVPGSGFLPRDFAFHQRVDELRLTNRRLDVDLTHEFGDIWSARLHYHDVSQRDRQLATRNADSEAGGALFLPDGLSFSGDPNMPIYTSGSGSRLDAEIAVAELTGVFRPRATTQTLNVGGSSARNTDVFGSREGDFVYLDGTTTLDIRRPTDRLTREQLGVAPGSPTLVYADFVRGDRIDSVYGQWLGTWTDRWRTIASVRRDSIRTFAREDIDGIAPDVLQRGIDLGTIAPTSLFGERSAERVVSWRIASSLDVGDAWTAFAGFAKSGEPQSGFTRAGAAIGTIANRSVEAGLRARLGNGRALASATVYRIEQDNIAIADPSNTPNESFLVPLGSARIEGVELEIVGKLSDTLSVFAGASLQDSDITRSGDPIVGNEFPNVPRFQASVFMNWNGAAFGFAGLDIGLGVAHQGRRAANSGNEYRLPAYERVDLGISYTTAGAIETRLQVNNLLDETYFTAAQDSVFGSDQVGVGDRRLLQLSITRRF